MSIGRPSSSEVAHEAEDTRAHLASTLEQLRTNLQPRNMMDEVVSNARVGAAAVADNLAGIARQHPIPSVLLAAGSALVMRLFSRRDAGAPAEAHPPAPWADDASDFRPAPGRGGSAATGLAALRRPAMDAGDPTSIQAGDSMQKVTRYLPSDRGEVRSRLATLFEEQPLVLGAIGLAVGAAIGAALPMTQAEDHLLGPTAHRVRGQATDAARQEVDEMRSAAGEAIDNLRQSARDNLRTVVDKAGAAFETGSRDV